MYKSILDIKETQRAIKSCKDYFERELAAALNLVRVSAPLFVTPESGLNDTLNGVDQWDWEKVITKEQRTLETLMETVRAIYKTLKNTEKYMVAEYPTLSAAYAKAPLPEEIFFVTTQELEDMYPEMTGKEREHTISREKGAVCIMQIGGKLKSGNKHDGRSPDYDDWTMNCDILLYFDVLDIGLEISSMGVRVDEIALARQLDEAGCNDRRSLPFHRAVLEKKLPYSIGGGIGQSRLCMFFLKKMHIGEVQASVWPEEQEDELLKQGCKLL